ncbi:MAG TPA: sensor domain-containing diguanylate cyclase [Nocardioides sp.]|nr:sensor domain-containing diguanylate cyclase [Nocardioides sp.]
MSTPEPLAETLLACMSESVYVVDRARRITYWNPAAERLTGFSAEEVVGRRCRDGILNHVDEAGRLLCTSGCPLSATMRDGGQRQLTAYLHHRDGHRVPVSITSSPLRDADGAITGAVEVFHDDGRGENLRAELRRAEALGLLDPLTEIPNRRALEGDVTRRHEVLRRNGRSFAVAFIDVDRFKSVNDTYGHDAGDRVLRLVAATLQNAVRPGDTVGRWGGEEFLLLADVPSEQAAVDLCQRVRSLVGRSWLDEDRGRLSVSVSIGVTLAAAGTPTEELVNAADHAMLSAKEAGRDRVVSR